MFWRLVSDKFHAYSISTVQYTVVACITCYYIATYMLHTHNMQTDIIEASTLPLLKDQ